MKCMNSIILCFFLTGSCIFDANAVQADQLQAVENDVWSLNDGVLTVNDGITEISAGILKDVDAAAITKVILPEGLKTIKVSTFKDFDNLKEIYIPSSVEFIPSRVFGASNIFSSNLKDGLKISINKAQMSGLIKFATDNLKPDSVRKTKGLNISWEILDSSTGKKLCKTFKPTFDEWNKYKNSSGYWKDVVADTPDVEEVIQAPTIPTKVENIAEISVTSNNSELIQKSEDKKNDQVITDKEPEHKSIFGVRLRSVKKDNVQKTRQESDNLSPEFSGKSVKSMIEHWQNNIDLNKAERRKTNAEESYRKERKAGYKYHIAEIEPKEVNNYIKQDSRDIIRDEIESIQKNSMLPDNRVFLKESPHIKEYVKQQNDSHQSYGIKKIAEEKAKKERKS